MPGEAGSHSGLRTRLTAKAKEIQEDVKDELIDYQFPEMEFRNMVTRNLTTDEGGKITLTVRKQSMNAQELGEGESPDYQHSDFRTIEVDVKEYGIHTGVTRIMVEDSRLDEIANATLEARRAMERKFNDLVIEELKTGWWDGNQDDDEIDDYGANDFDGTHDHIKQVASGNTELGMEDIAEGIHLVNEHGYRADTLIINSAQVKDLQEHADFTAGGVSDPLRQELQRAGAIGTIYGLTVFVNDWLDADNFIVMDRAERPIAWVERRPLTIDEGDAGFGIIDSYYSWRGGQGTIRRGAGCYLSLA